jgi:outer membrane PBP1 activator LpoA protein
MTPELVRAARCGLLIVALLVGACASVPGLGPNGAERAELAYAAGDFANAAREFIDAADRSNGADRDYLTLRAAESYRQLGDFAAVDHVAQALQHDRLDAGDQLRLDLLLAEVALSRNEPDTTLDLLTVPPDSVPDALRPRFHELRARAFIEKGDALAAARERAAQLPYLPEAARDPVQTQLNELLSAVPVQELYRLSAGLSPDDPLKAAADASLGTRGVMPPRMMAGGRDPMAPREPPPTDSDGRALYGKVALLLPLSGQIAVAGQAVRDGFMAAYFAGTAPRPEVDVIDAGSTAETAIAAYRQALENGAERVVGPLSREAVSALFREPMLPVPVLALNHADGVAPPEGSVQFGLLPDEEAIAAADRLIRLGALRAVVLSLDEDWSTRAALAFRIQYEAAGGQVVQDIRIGRRDYDFTRHVRTIGDSQADGLFMALNSQPARLLVPQLKAASIGGTWLAMSRVYGGTPLPALDRDLDGLEFSDAPWVIGTASGVPSREELAASVRNIQGPALRLFAFGMDAYRLLGYVDWLSGRPYSFINGATGELSVDEARQVRRQMAWARFQGGVPVPVEGALSFGDTL